LGVGFDLIFAGTLGEVPRSKDVEFVERGEDNEEDVPQHEDNPVPLVQLPSIVMSGKKEKSNGGEEGEG
jgi:hypothetical protein